MDLSSAAGWLVVSGSRDGALLAAWLAYLVTQNVTL